MIAACIGELRIHQAMRGIPLDNDHLSPRNSAARPATSACCSRPRHSLRPCGRHRAAFGIGGKARQIDLYGIVRVGNVVGGCRKLHGRFGSRRLRRHQHRGECDSSQNKRGRTPCLHHLGLHESPFYTWFCKTRSKSLVGPSFLGISYAHLEVGAKHTPVQQAFQ